MGDLVPVTIERRMPRHGKIRLGNKGAKGQPQKLGTFRFTSPDEEAIAALANIYGGTYSKWDGAPTDEQWQVTCESKAIKVILPEDPMYGPYYELWTRGGLSRRCNGIECEVPKQSEDGAFLSTEPCICDANGRLECKQKLRIDLLLPGIPFRGTWALESSGWNAIHELPGMVDLILATQARGMVSARLSLEQRKQTKNGKTRNFVVPVLGLDHTLDELTSGAANLGGTKAPAVEAPPAQPALDAGEDVPDPYDDDEIVEAEIVSDPSPADPDMGALSILMSSVAANHSLELEKFEGAMIEFATVKDGDGNLVLDKDRLAEALQGLSAGTMIWRGIDEGGAARINRITKKPQ